MNIWVKRGLVVLAGVGVLVLRQYGADGHVDLQALATHLAEEADKLIVAFSAGWLLVGRPEMMKPKAA